MVAVFPFLLMDPHGGHAVAIPVIQVVLHRVGDRVDPGANPFTGGLEEGGLEPLPGRILGLLPVQDHLAVGIGNIIRGTKGPLSPVGPGSKVAAALAPGHAPPPTTSGKFRANAWVESKV